MQSTLSESTKQQIALICLAAQLILENGGETYRVEETALRMAKGFGLKNVNIAAFPTSIFVEVDGHMRVTRINRRGTNTTRLERTNSVSRSVERGEMTAQQAQAELEAIAALPGLPLWVQIAASGLTAASFSLLFGGRLSAFAVSFLIGMLVQLVQPLFSNMEMGALFGCFAGGAITALLAQASSQLLPAGSVNAVIAGGIMPLLTGLLMTTAMRDTMYGDLVSGVTRAAEALLLAASVALGVYVGLEIAAMMGGMLL